MDPYEFFSMEWFNRISLMSPCHRNQDFMVSRLHLVRRDGFECRLFSPVSYSHQACHGVGKEFWARLCHTSLKKGSLARKWSFHGTFTSRKLWKPKCRSWEVRNCLRRAELQEKTCHESWASFPWARTSLGTRWRLGKEGGRSFKLPWLQAFMESFPRLIFRSMRVY